MGIRFVEGDLLEADVLNLPTKRHWRAKARLEDVDAGLAALATWARGRGVSSIAVPQPGCGLGGFDWEVVRPRIQDAPWVEVEKGRNVERMGIDNPH